MNVLIIGGTGLISAGIVKHLLARGANVTVYNRSQRENTLPSVVKALIGDRKQFDAFEATFKDQRFDVVIDMICFNADEANSDVRAFGGRCEHFIFCSTGCTYGVKVPPNVFLDENFPQEPISGYGRNKLECEKIFLAAHDNKKFHATIIRPSHTYGPSAPMIDNLEFNTPAWDRIERGLPVICAGDGLGLWVSTHRDDCGKLFAYGALNPKTYGQSYNATRDDHTTWQEYYRQIASVLGKQAHLVYMPASWIVKHDPGRFGLLKEITAFHGAYDSSKARRDVPEYKCEIGLIDGVKQVFADLRRRNAWKDSGGDKVYEAMLEGAKKLGIEPVAI